MISVLQGHRDVEHSLGGNALEGICSILPQVLGEHYNNSSHLQYEIKSLQQMESISFLRGHCNARLLVELHAGILQEKEIEIKLL